VAKLMQQTNATVAVERNCGGAAGMVQDFEVCGVPVWQADGIDREIGDATAENFARGQQHR